MSDKGRQWCQWWQWWQLWQWWWDHLVSNQHLVCVSLIASLFPGDVSLQSRRCKVYDINICILPYLGFCLINLADWIGCYAKSKLKISDTTQSSRDTQGSPRNNLIQPNNALPALVLGSESSSMCCYLALVERLSDQWLIMRDIETFSLKQMYLKLAERKIVWLFHIKERRRNLVWFNQTDFCIFWG